MKKTLSLIFFYFSTMILPISNTLAFNPYDIEPEHINTLNQASLIRETTNTPIDSSELLDFYAGTIQIINTRYILKRCNISRSEYILNFKDQSNKDKIDELLKSNTIFWLNTISSYSSINEEHYLNVVEIDAIHTNESCQMEDFFNKLLEDPELFSQLKELLTPHK